MPLLHIIPILHSAADMGSLAPVVAERRNPRSLGQIDDFWRQLRDVVEALDLPLERLRVYQDSLPCCGFEKELVQDLARKGSANFLLLTELHAAGAQIEGTESIDLLIAELNWAKSRVAGGPFVRPPASAGAATLSAEELLESRDRFIAQRILETLQDAEEGLLFIGMLHDVGAWLHPSIQVNYPLGATIR